MWTETGNRTLVFFVFSSYHAHVCVAGVLLFVDALLKTTTSTEVFNSIHKRHSYVLLWGEGKKLSDFGMWYVLYHLKSLIQDSLSKKAILAQLLIIIFMQKLLGEILWPVLYRRLDYIGLGFEILQIQIPIQILTHIIFHIAFPGGFYKRIFHLLPIQHCSVKMLQLRWHAPWSAQNSSGWVFHNVL